MEKRDAKHFYQSPPDFQGKSGVSIRTWLYSKKFGSRSVCYASTVLPLSLSASLVLQWWPIEIYITISTFTSVRPSGVGVGVGVGVGGVRRHVPLSNFQFLQSYDKVSLIKVGWYVLRVKNIHSWSPPDPFGP